MTTNITAGQIFFILLTVLFSSLMFFYLGAKFGPEMLDINTSYENIEDSFLPDEAQAQEIKKLIKTKKHQYVFFEALQSGENKLTIPVVEQPAKTAKKEVEKKKEEKKSPQVVQKPVTNTVVATSNKKSEEKKIEEKKTEPKEEQKVEKKNAVVEKEEVKTDYFAFLKQTKKTKKEEEPEAEDKQKEIELPGVLYHLQIGSYAKKKQAKEARKVWKKRGYSASITKTTIAGKGNWYRLRVGQYASLDEAQEAQSKIMRVYRHSSRVIKIKK